MTAKRAKTGGRSVGTPNKATRAFRDTVNALLQENSENVSLWLSDVARDDPAKALDLLTKLAEYATPKLARQEHVGEGGGPLVVEIVRFGKNTAS
jgi:hypothetical protein